MKTDLRASERHYRCPAIIYYNIYNIQFVNLHKISRAFLCNIPYCNLESNGYNNKRKVNQ